jgi:hypothetical protein
MVELSVNERYGLMSILPAEGNIVNLRLIRDLQMALAFSDDEITKYDVTLIPQANGAQGIMWNREKAEGQLKEIPIGSNTLSIVTERLRKLNEERKLTIQLIDLYERFIEKRITVDKTTENEIECENEKMRQANAQ